MHGRAWFGAVMTGWPGIQAWLAPDDPDAAERRLEEARRHWRPFSEPHMPDFLLAAADMTVLAYRDQHAQALEVAQKTVREHGSAPWTKMFALPSMAMFLAIPAAALLRSDPGFRHSELRAIATRCIATIRRAGHGMFAAQAWPIEAALAIDRGDHDTAIARLRGLMTLFPQSGVRYGMCQMALGEHLGGDEGKANVMAGRKTLHAHGVANIEAFFQSRFGFCRP